MAQMLIWRRHTAKCPHRHKGREFLKCTCPLWADGYSNGKRAFRVSLKTREYARALKRAATLDELNAPVHEPIGKAIDAFMRHCADLEQSTRRKYQNVLDHLKEFCKVSNIEAVSEIRTEHLDAYRAGREL